MSITKIKKGIVRGIQTKKFEQVTITLDIEEEIEWNTEEERSQETKKVSDRLIDDFKKTYNEVVGVLGVDRCISIVDVDESGEDKSSDGDDDIGWLG